MTWRPDQLLWTANSTYALSGIWRGSSGANPLQLCPMMRRKSSQNMLRHRHLLFISYQLLESIHTCWLSYIDRRLWILPRFSYKTLAHDRRSIVTDTCKCFISSFKWQNKCSSWSLRLGIVVGIICALFRNTCTSGCLALPLIATKFIHRNRRSSFISYCISFTGLGCFLRLSSLLLGLDLLNHNTRGLTERPELEDFAVHMASDRKLET